MRPRVTSVGLILPPPAPDFATPTHIDRASLDALPGKPGIYIFRNRRNEPVYIGKSVNIRSRVMAHLRTPEEMAMLRESRRVDFIRTAGEIGALLLESRLIKEHQPPWNAQIKVMAESYALYLDCSGAHPQVAACSEVPMSKSAFLYGLFASRSAALEGLQALVRRHMLCPALLGMEAVTLGRACFSHQIGRCRGACIGAESCEAHRDRLRSALEELNRAIWPYAGPIGIVEADDRWRQIHVVHKWSYIGSLDGRRRKITLPARHIVDIDTYKILSRPLAEGRLAIKNCEVRKNAAYFIEPEAVSRLL